MRQETWSVRELKRQINTSLFERILLSEGKANKETVLNLSKKGIELLRVEDVLKDPSNQIFASKYTLYIPEKERLIKEVEAIIEEWHKEQ